MQDRQMPRTVTETCKKQYEYFSNLLLFLKRISREKLIQALFSLHISLVPTVDQQFYFFFYIHEKFIKQIQIMSGSIFVEYNLKFTRRYQVYLYLYGVSHWRHVSFHFVLLMRRILRCTYSILTCSYLSRDYCFHSLFLLFILTNGIQAARSLSWSILSHIKTERHCNLPVHIQLYNIQYTYCTLLCYNIYGLPKYQVSFSIVITRTRLRNDVHKMGCPHSTQVLC